MVLPLLVHLWMTNFSLGVSEPDIVYVISLNDFPLINVSSLSLNPGKAKPAVAGLRFRRS